MVLDSKLCSDCQIYYSIPTLWHIASILNELAQAALDLVPAEACFAYLPDHDNLTFSGMRKAGRTSRIHAYVDAAGGRHVCPLAEFSARNKETLNLSDLSEIDQYLQQHPAASWLVPNLAHNLGLAAGVPAYSTLIIPIRDADNGILAVIQLVNKIECDGRPGAFSESDQEKIEKLAKLSSSSLSGAQFMRSVMSGLVESVALHDSAETYSHADRVGAISAEIYHHIALSRGISPQVMLQSKDYLRIAGTLHDIGKIGISENILQKPGRLTPEERSVMERHCVIGARLFSFGRREIDKAVRDVALYHHQRWDGHGYTGDSQIANLHGEEIPLSARIVAVADVYDALVSRRCYKEPWEHDAAVAAVKMEVGTHFDPEVVNAFIGGEGVIAAIKEFYADKSVELNRYV